jgi:hypothetical protein
VRLAEEQGYGRIAVANRHMVGWSRLYRMEFREALEDGLAAAGKAAQVSQLRAEVASLLLVGTMNSKMGNLDLATDHLERTLALTQRIGSGNFRANVLWELSRIRLAGGDPAAARRLIQDALDTARAFAMTFVGPGVLASWAALAEDNTARQKALEEAEAILASGCVGHNYFWFAETAIDDALARGEWDRVERYAQMLEDYTRKQPLPWADFTIRRGRALAAWHRDGPDEELAETVAALLRQAADAELNTARPLLEQALAAA